jgi:arsenite methyltransferase
VTRIEIFDPPMCCATGVCGPSVDPVLPRFVADLHWLANQGVSVTRYNLSQDPQAFATNSDVKAALTSTGNACLPLILVDGQIASQGVYPDRKQLAALTGLDPAKAQVGVALPVVESAS